MAQTETTPGIEQLSPVRDIQYDPNKIADIEANAEAIPSLRSGLALLAVARQIEVGTPAYTKGGGTNRGDTTGCEVSPTRYEPPGGNGCDP